MLDYAVGQGYHAVDAQAWRDKLDGYAVASGLEVTVDTGLTLNVASGTATVGETSGSVDTVSLGSSTSITLDAADGSNPRKDVIYIDTAGSVQKETGVAESALPSGNTRFNTYQPEPSFPSTDGVLLAEVWVAAGASSLSSGDVRDRRVPADSVGDRAAFQTANAEVLLNKHSQPVGVGPGYATTADPANYATDADALQAINDALVSNLANGDTGFVHIPSRKPDDTLLDITKTVQFGQDGSDVHVLPQGTPGHDQYNGIKVSITDGSPAFHISGGSVNTKIQQEVEGLSWDLQGNDCEALRVSDAVSLRFNDLMVRNAGPSSTSDGVFVLDGAVHGIYWESSYVYGGTTTTDVLTAVNDTGNGPPGNNVIGPGFMVSATCRSGYRQSAGNPITMFAGHIEGYDGTSGTGAAVLHEDGGLGVTPYTNIGAGHNGADAIHSNTAGAILQVAPGASLGSPDRHGVYVAGSGGVRIGWFQTTPGTGDSINIDSGYNAQVPSRLPAASEIRGTISENSGDANIVQNSVS